MSWGEGSKSATFSFEPPCLHALSMAPKEEAFGSLAACREALGREGAAQTIESLLDTHPTLEFTVQEARSAALSRQDEALRLVRCRRPQVQVMGLDIFDRRYPGFVLTDCHKCCIKMMLARGARLGQFAPSKLLRRVETDMLGLWLQCFLRSLMLAGVHLPDPVRKRSRNSSLHELYRRAVTAKTRRANG